MKTQTHKHKHNHTATPATTQTLDHSFTTFQKAVRDMAQTITHNKSAGCTADECKYMHRYYISNQRQSLRVAIAQCACGMVEALRYSELPRIH